MGRSCLKNLSQKGSLCTLRLRSLNKDWNIRLIELSRFKMETFVTAVDVQNKSPTTAAKKDELRLIAIVDSTNAICQSSVSKKSFLLG